MIREHYIPNYFLNPTHRITINLIGCGGTGSQVLSALARMNEALIGLDHPSFFVTVYDNDIVTEANVGRQLYSPADVGYNKAVVSVTRVNRFFGLDWQAQPYSYNASFVKNNNQKAFANITITCVDSAAARVEISKLHRIEKRGEPTQWQYYWMDFGNLKQTGQVVMGTIGTPKDDKSGGILELPDVMAMFPKVRKMKSKDTGPSCSLAQALGKQDLFINSTLAQLGMNILWTLFRYAKISYHGCFLNLQTLSVNAIRI